MRPIAAKLSITSASHVKLHPGTFDTDLRFFMIDVQLVHRFFASPLRG